MGHLSSLLKGLSRSFSPGRRRTSACSGTNDASEAADAMARDAKRNDMILRSSGAMAEEGPSGCFVSVFSRRGEKGINQDCTIVWKEFGGQKDTIFCGVYDGHGPWGKSVAKMVRERLPRSLLCCWQETLIMRTPSSELDLVPDKSMSESDIWRQSFLRTCDAVDKELKVHRGLDSFCSGTTALTVVKQGDLVVLANVGDSRAVLATVDDDAGIAPVQLTVDCKPNLPHETERITRCNGRVFCLEDEPGVYRLWLPSGESPGLAMSRALGDYCVKDFGLTSEPEVIHRNITSGDQFIVLATDGVWDVVTNQEAVRIVSSAKDRRKAAKELVEYAVKAWRRKRQDMAVDDCSAICLFLRSPPPP